MNDWMINGSTLDISELAAGNYILKIEQGSVVDFVRLIVMK